jgi:hypothetical protein
MAAIDAPPNGLSLEMLWLLMVQNDRLYQERHDGAKLALKDAFAAQQAALDNASKASDAAIKNEHDVIEARNSVLTAADAALEKRVTSLEVSAGKDTGRREPAGEVIKWIGVVLAGLILWALSHFAGK